MERNEALAPASEVMQLLTGFYVSKAIFLATECGLIDRLGEKPQTGDELAAAGGFHPHALVRLLRLLTGAGLLEHHDDGRFSLTEKGALLRSDVPDSLRDVAWLFAGPHPQALWAELETGMRTDKPVFEKAFGTTAFGYFPQHPDEGMIFNKAMTYFAGKISGAVNEVYDFSPFHTVVDVGGGQGMLVRSILAANPHLKGILIDLPHVVDSARAEVAASDLADRMEIVGGSFFEGVPAGGDCYILKSVIHDWDDDFSRTILKHIHKVLPENGRLLIVEPVVTDTTTESAADLIVAGSDINMMLTVGGAERTETEYRELLAGVGFKLERIFPLGGLSTGIHGVHSVIEITKIS